MVDSEKLLRKSIQLDEFLAILEGIKKTGRDAFIQDKILIGSAKYYLQVSIECCLNIANHIISAERYRVPKDYADSFKVLEESGVIELSLGARLRQMAKFRNRLVHLCGEIDDTYAHSFLVNDLIDITKFKKTITHRFVS